jgi:AraC family transcriptional regulator, transcriptional activator for feuABC-ybbA operon
MVFHQALHLFKVAQKAQVILLSTLTHKQRIYCPLHRNMERKNGTCFGWIEFVKDKPETLFSSEKMEVAMILKNLFFHIHYCKYRKFDNNGGYSKRITWILQHHELIYIAGGEGSIILERKKYPLKGGMLLYICPDVLHSMEIDAEGPGCFYSVHFSFVGINFNDGSWDINDKVKIVPLHPVQALQDSYPIQEAFKKLTDSWNAKLPGYEFVARTLLEQLLIAIYQNTQRQNQNYGASLKVEKIIAFMHENINSQITLAQLAELVQLSPTYLSRAFKETTEYSVIEYFNKMKIDKAKELLIEGGKKVKEVAGVLGFSDEFYFSRIFKKIEGVSPSEFYSRNVHGY